MRKKIPEVDYRSSRICRVLGNPTAYEILKLLAHGKYKPTEIADEFGLSIPTISAVLRSLRQLDLVRYETVPDGKMYFLKEPAIIDILKRLESFADDLKKIKF